MTPDDGHSPWQALLAASLTDDLSPDEAVRLRAHVDGCPRCAADLAELGETRGALRSLDAEALGDAAVPPAGLGASIRAAVAGERVLVERRRRRHALARRTGVAAAAVAVLAGGVVLGYQVDRPTPVVVPYEAVALTSEVQGVVVTKAGVVPHTWGLELKVVASGFDRGATYRAFVTTRSGRRVPAGEFLGTGARAMTCDLQSAVLRADSAAVEVDDAQGHRVLDAHLPLAE
jgi:hypothetical protein